jgi:8-oxo-dGTP diphosphatase
MPEGNADSGIIQAAGGLVWRVSPEGLGRELAVIFRTRHHDWTLPKGKLKPGEKWQEAACREVKEETGCAVEMGDFVGCISYMDEGKGVPKVVLFWNMTLVGDCRFKPSEEVGEVLWLSPSDALKRLDHPAEKSLLIDVLNNPGMINLMAPY